VPALAGAQKEEHLSQSVVSGLAKAIADAPVPGDYASRPEVASWIGEVSRRIAHKVATDRERTELLATTHYESMRAGLDPQMVLAVMYHESGFKKYAFSSAQARGYMQVMPFWVKLIGSPDQNLFNLRTNLRSALLTQQGAVASVRTQYVSAQQELAAADSLSTRKLVSSFEVQNRRAQASEATTRLRVEQERLKLMEQAIDAQIATQASQVAQLQAIAANQRDRLRSLQVRAPDRGVLQDLTLQLGQWVPEGTTLAKVVQPGDLKAVLRIPESQAKDVAIGQIASIDTRNGIVRGHVTRKDPSAQGGSVTVDVSLDDPPPPGAVPDLSVDGTVVIDHLKNVMYSGRPAFSAGSGTATVFKLVDDGKYAMRVPVELGKSSVNVIEIIRGLEIGDRIIVSDMSQYANAPRIRIK
jgi:multidrug efflux pump subunit AcrA (membrane-fusion protein)